MKKFARILCLALVAVMLCATLASCGGPAKDPKDAAAALKGNGYTVTVETDVLVSAIKDGEHITINYCADKDEATKKYDEAVAAKEKAEEELKKAEDELKAKQDEIAEMEDGVAKELAEAGLSILQAAVDTAKAAANVEVGQSGNMVWMGTAQAVKDAK